MLKTPKIYRLITALALVLTCPIATFAAEDYFPSLADATSASATSADVSTQAATKDEKNTRKIKDIEIHGLNVIPEADVLSKLGFAKGDAYKRESIQNGLKNVYQMGYFTETMRAIPVNNPDGTVTLKIIL